MARMIYRNPFAREELHRENAGLHKCAWCGRDGKTFHYYVETDGGRRFNDGRVFCCKGCRNDYYDVKA